MWYSNGMLHYIFKAEFVTLASLKVPSGRPTVPSPSFLCCFFPLSLSSVFPPPFLPPFLLGIHLCGRKVDVAC